jgi:hypothetical protein
VISCRYVGGDSSFIGDREFDSVGQRAALSEQTYLEAVLGGAAFISEEDFKRINFTQGELDKYGSIGSRFSATSSFLEKLVVAQEIYRETRRCMLIDRRQTLAEAGDVVSDPELVAR